MNSREMNGREMNREMNGVILCRYGEIFLKSGNRRRFEGVLHNNVRRALADLSGARIEAPRSQHLPLDGGAVAYGHRVADTSPWRGEVGPRQRAGWG